MAESQIKVSSIMFTDIVGYSSMMSKDESHSLQLLMEHNRIIEPVILKHSGKIIKYIGDSIFAQNTDVSTVGSGIKQSFTKTQKLMLVK